MPSKSAKQHRLMAAVAKNPAFAKKVGIKQSVSEEFLRADKGRKFGTGGQATITRGGKGEINRQATRFGSVYGQEKNVPNINLNKYIGKKEGGLMKHDDLMEDKKLIKKAFKMHDTQEHKGQKGTDLSKLKKGGMAMKKMAMGGQARSAVKGEHPVQKRAKQGAEMIKMAKGGTASARADGIAQKGKTKGKLLCGGGMAKKK
jgi:hypothetical protein